MVIESAWVFVFSISVILLLMLFFHLQNRKMYVHLTELKNQASLQLLPQWLAELRASMDRNTDIMNRQVSSANDAVSQRLDATAQLLRLLNQDLGHVHQIGRQMRDFQNLFRSPKIRGRLGEQIMEEILLQVLPRSVVSTQHRFQAGPIVDAVIKLDGGLIPVDAKFPLENYQKAQNADQEELAQSLMKEFNRDVKRHINTISSKYILPGEGTLDFAIMYIPSNTLYYEIISDDDLLKEAEAKHVLCVSPNSLFYFLRLVLAGLYSGKIEKTAALVMQHINAFEQNIREISTDLSTLLTHINNSGTAGARVAQRLQSLEKKLENLLYMDKENVNN